MRKRVAKKAEKGVAKRRPARSGRTGKPEEPVEPPTLEKVLEKILERLQSMDPPVKQLGVNPPDPAMGVYLLPLAEVCYITTRSDAGREETALVTKGGKTFYSALTMDALTTKLKEHPHFMRTSRFYLVNLSNVRAYRMSSARDLWFEGIKDPLINAVTDSYKDLFDVWANG